LLFLKIKEKVVSIHTTKAVEVWLHAYFISTLDVTGQFYVHFAFSSAKVLPVAID
jgi:hypothetical protein